MSDSLIAALHRFEKLDLGETWDDAGCKPVSVSTDRKKHFPSIYVNSKGESGDKFAKIPRSGKALVDYKVRSRTIREDEDGVKRHEVSIEIQSLDPQGDEPKKKKGIEAVKQELGAAMGELVQLARGDAVVRGLDKIVPKSFLPKGETIRSMMPAITKAPATHDDNFFRGLQHRAERNVVAKGVRIMRGDGVFKRRRPFTKSQLTKYGATIDRRVKAIPHPENHGASAWKELSVSASPHLPLFMFSGPLGERTRDGAGRFDANETGGADPLTMHQAYGAPKKSSMVKPLLVATAATAAGAGAIGVHKAQQKALRHVQKNYGGPGVPLRDSLRSAFADFKSAAVKKLSRIRPGAVM